MSPGDRAPRAPRQAGFALAELLVVTAVLGVVMTGLLGLLMTGQRTYLFATTLVDAQQNVRVAIEQLAKDIREAGYHPRTPDTAPATCPSGPGNLYPSGPPCWNFYPITSQSATGFTLQYDWNGDGTSASSGKVNDPVLCPTGSTCRGERVIWSFASSNLSRQEIGVNGSAIVIASGLSSVSFVYLDETGATTSSRDLMRSVRVTISAKSGGSAADVTMTDQIRLRNR
jgi:prepilin-type N-terminal cleavage/methylation domain-containing protein